MLSLFVVPFACIYALALGSECTVPFNEYDRQDDCQGSLSLIQKRAANQQTHSREQPAQEPSEDESAPKEKIEKEEKKEKGRRSSAEGELPEGEAAAEEPRPLKRNELALRRSCPAAQAVTILGSMCFIIALFYLVNSTSVLLVSTAWTIVSESTSILLAVLIYNLKHKIIDYLSGEKGEGGVDAEEVEGEELSFTTLSQVRFFALLFFMWWFVVTSILFLSKGSLLHLKAFGTIGGHILGFAAINFWATLMCTETFQGSTSMALLVVVMYIGSFQISIHIKNIIMHKVVSTKEGEERENYVLWHEQSYDTAKDSFCIGCSFLLRMWIEYVIAKFPAPIHEQRRTHSTMERCNLAGVGFFCLALAALFKKLSIVADEEERHWGAFMHHVLSDGGMTTAMTAGWLFTAAIHWKVFDAYGNGFFANTSVALCLSFVAWWWVIFCYCLRQYFHFTRRMLRGTLVAVALGVGFSWEKVFDASVEHLSELQGANEMMADAFQAMLIMFIFPAWMLYILPQDMQELHDAMSDRLKKGPLNFSALWSDDGLYNPGYLAKLEKESFSKQSSHHSHGSHPSHDHNAAEQPSSR